MPSPKRVNQRIAILSDIHGNLVALYAVLDDIIRQGIDRIVVAGDMAGFGPDPDGVVDLLMQRGAEMIRGNHEQDYVAIYDTPAMPPEWKTSIRWSNVRWTMERLGTSRRAFLTNLPDACRVDDRALVVHGSPRSARDAVLSTTPEAELEAMFVGCEARLVFMGHTHRPLVRDLASRRLINVGSVGMPLDCDPRACYAVVAQPDGRDTFTHEVSHRRVSYDVEAAIAAYDDSLAAADPYLAAILVRQLRTGQNFFAPWLRLSRDIPDELLSEALRDFLTSDG